MAYDKVAGAPDDAANPGPTRDTSVSKKTVTKIKDGGGENLGKGSEDDTPPFWIKVGASRIL